MLPSKFEANPMLGLRVRHTSFSLFPLASLCSNDYYCAYAIINSRGFPKDGHTFRAWALM